MRVVEGIFFDLTVDTGAMTSRYCLVQADSMVEAIQAVKGMGHVTNCQSRKYTIILKEEAKG